MPSSSSQKKYYRRVVGEYTREARVLFLYETYHQKPFLVIEDINFHMLTIMKAVLVRLKDADKKVWPPDRIHSILHAVVNEYIGGLPGI